MHVFRLKKKIKRDNMCVIIIFSNIYNLSVQKFYLFKFNQTIEQITHPPQIHLPLHSPHLHLPPHHLQNLHLVFFHNKNYSNPCFEFLQNK